MLEFAKREVNKWAGLCHDRLGRNPESHSTNEVDPVVLAIMLDRVFEIERQQKERDRSTTTIMLAKSVEKVLGGLPGGGMDAIEQRYVSVLLLRACNDVPTLFESPVVSQQIVALVALRSAQQDPQHKIPVAEEQLEEYHSDLLWRAYQKYYGLLMTDNREGDAYALNWYVMEAMQNDAKLLETLVYKHLRPVPDVGSMWSWASGNAAGSWLSTLMGAPTSEAVNPRAEANVLSLMKTDLVSRMPSFWLDMFDPTDVVESGLAKFIFQNGVHAYLPICLALLEATGGGYPRQVEQEEEFFRRFLDGHSAGKRIKLLATDGPRSAELRSGSIRERGESKLVFSAVENWHSKLRASGDSTMATIINSARELHWRARFAPNAATPPVKEPPVKDAPSASWWSTPWGSLYCMNGIAICPTDDAEFLVGHKNGGGRTISTSL